VPEQGQVRETGCTVVLSRVVVVAQLSLSLSLSLVSTADQGRKQQGGFFGEVQARGETPEHKPRLGSASCCRRSETNCCKMRRENGARTERGSVFGVA
jgi:hypothetical protein